MSVSINRLTLNRGGPVIWLSENDAKSAGIVDNDWVELYNTNGALTARAVVSQRMKDGTTFMYHAQEKIVNTPGSEKTGKRGGIHNSVTRATVKPTHMIGGYAQQSYGFNYYGTVGANRDEFVIVKKMKKVDWLDREATGVVHETRARPALAVGPFPFGEDALEEALAAPLVRFLHALDARQVEAQGDDGHGFPLRRARPRSGARSRARRCRLRPGSVPASRDSAGCPWAGNAPDGRSS